MGKLTVIYTVLTIISSRAKNLIPSVTKGQKEKTTGKKLI